ncbi:MAG: thioredoxin family protein [Phycisphaerae bacterium]|jgi:small redox-active disulfide protein 2
MKIEILGTGCKKCNRLAENAKEAIALAAVDAEIVKVTDLAQIMSYNVISTPALVIDGEVKSTGKLLKPKDIAKILGEAK